MSPLQYDRLTAKTWPALDTVIERFLEETEVGEIEALAMGLGETGNPECRLFYREGAE